MRRNIGDIRATRPLETIGPFFNDAFEVALLDAATVSSPLPWPASLMTTPELAQLAGRV